MNCIENCGRFAQKGGRCAPCRMRMLGLKRRDPLWTPGLEAEVRRCYEATTYKELKRNIAAFAQRHPEIPMTKFRSCVKRLELQFMVEKLWTAAECQLLYERAGIDTTATIARKLGRTLKSVKTKAAKLKTRLRVVRDGYSREELKLCLGVSSTRFERWERTGVLTRWGDRYSEADVRAFLHKHFAEYDLRRVDQTWFKGMVFGE